LGPIFALNKMFELAAASLAFEKAGCEDRDQESDRIEGFKNALLPLLAPSNVLRIVEDGKLLSRLRLHFAAEALTKLTQAPVLVFIVEADVAHESCWKLTHRANLTVGIIRTARLRDKLAAVRFLSLHGYDLGTCSGIRTTTFIRPPN